MAKQTLRRGHLSLTKLLLIIKNMELLDYTKKNLEIFLKESNAIENVFEQKAYEDALLAWGYLQKATILGEKEIKTAHYLLMNNQLQKPYCGVFRPVDVMVGTWIAPAFNNVPILMWKWCFETLRQGDPVEPITHHIQFEKIHPFLDGNGRMGRILMNWLCLKQINKLIVFSAKDKHDEYYPLFK